MWWGGGGGAADYSQPSCQLNNLAFFFLRFSKVKVLYTSVRSWRRFPMSPKEGNSKRTTHSQSPQDKKVRRKCWGEQRRPWAGHPSPAAPVLLRHQAVGKHPYPMTSNTTVQLLSPTPLQGVTRAKRWKKSLTQPQPECCCWGTTSSMVPKGQGQQGRREAGTQPLMKGAMSMALGGVCLISDPFCQHCRWAGCVRPGSPGHIAEGGGGGG